MSNIQARVLSAVHKVLANQSFPDLAAAQEAAHAVILDTIPDDKERVRIEGDEQGVNAKLTITVDPTDGEDDAFAMEYIGTLGPHNWTFKFLSALAVKDKR